MALKFLNDGYFAGKVGIGTQTPLRGDLVVKGDFQTVSSGNGQLAVISGVLGSNPSDADVGGQMVFGGPISSSDSDRTFGLVGGYKENNTSGDRAGYLSFGTRQNTGSRDIFERMRIDSSGNVGIGTTGPGSKLDVRGTGNFLGTAVSGAALVTIENNSGSTATSYGLLVKGGGNSSSGKTFEVRDDSGNTDLIVKGNGNVGIGTVSPIQKLDTPNIVIGGSTIAGTYRANSLAIDNNGGTSRFYSFGPNTSTNGAYVFHIANSDATTNPEIIRIASDGNVGIGTTSPAAPLDVAFADNSSPQRWSYSPSESNFFLELDTNIPTSGVVTYNFNVKTNGTTYNNNLVLDRGNVGIGTTLPDAKLEVNTDTNNDGITLNGSSDNLRFNIKNDQVTSGKRAFSIMMSGSYPALIFQGLNNSYGFTRNIMAIEHDGNVGIGTISPDYKLDIRSGELSVRPGSSGNGGLAKIGHSSSNAILQLYDASGNEDVRISTSLSSYFNGGNVGIGTTSPNQLLEVANSSGGATINISTDQSPGSQASKKYVTLDFSGYSNDVMARIQSWDESSSTGHGHLTFSTRKGGVGLSQAMLIDENGNVGIGTDSPDAKLEIYGTDGLRTRFNEGLRVTRETVPTQYGMFNYNGGALNMIAVNTAGTGSVTQFMRSGNGTSLDTSMVIDTNGNVGIGTTNPGSPLEVQFAEANGTSKEMLHLDYNPTDNYGSAIFKISSGGSANNFFEIEQVTGGGAGDFGTYVDTNIINRNASSGAYGNINFITGSSTSASSIVMTIGGGTQKGNVGIGTSSPATRLEVKGAASTRNALSNILTLNGGENVSNPYDGFGVGAVFKGRDYSNAIRDYAYIYGVIEDQTSSSTPAGDPGFESQLRFYTNTGGTSAALPTQKMVITSAGDVGIGVTNPSNKLEIAGKATSTSTVSTDAATTLVTKDYVDSSAGNPSYFRQGHKSHTLTNAFTTCLTVNLNSHTGCYVTVCCFGDWGSHSAAAYRGEFFLQNGANGYSEPGIILRQDDNTSNGNDQIVCQIVDPTSTANPKDFEIQIRTTATTGTTSFTGLITFTVQGKFNSVT